MSLRKDQRRGGVESRHAVEGKRGSLTERATVLSGEQRSASADYKGTCAIPMHLRIAGVAPGPRHHQWVCSAVGR